MTQKEALNILKLGHNTFLTGSAGTGKTYVLNQFIDYLKRYGINHAVTASTGIASTHLGGVTIHSWSGIGIKDVVTGADLELMKQNEKLYLRYMKVKVLIIDEVSMLHASRIDMIDKVARFMRDSDQVFGGIQIVFCGDFFQLPPVVRDKLVNIQNEYAFNSNAWKKSKPVICYLTENYRQEDNTLTNILNAIRRADEEIYESLESLNETGNNELVNAVKLYTHNENVDALNLENYKSLHMELDDVQKKKIKEFEYEMVCVGKKNLLENLRASVLTSELLKLKSGTKVMFIKNDKGGKYSNGTLGVVKDFNSDNMPVVETLSGESITVYPDSWQIKDDNDKVLAEISQVPLRYAWAITIHKSQGMTLDEAEIDLSRGFGFGMGYVALSRVRTMAGLKVIGLNNEALRVAPFVLEENSKLMEKSDLAVDALLKYSEVEIETLHAKVREKMSGLKSPLSDDELIESENQSATAKLPTSLITFKFILEGKNLDEIAKERDIKLSSVIDHTEDLLSHEALTGENKELIKSLVENKLNEIIKKNKITKKVVNEIKKDLKQEDKLKTTYIKYKSIIPEIDYEFLKLLKIIT